MPISIAVENRGTMDFSARTSPDALKIWVYIKKLEHEMIGASDSTLVPLREEWAVAKHHLPAPGDVMVATSRLSDGTSPGSPEIRAGQAARFTGVTEVTLEPHLVCGEALVVVTADPMNQLPDRNTTNNAMAVRVVAECTDVSWRSEGRCYLYNNPMTDRAVVAMHHSWMDDPVNMVEYSPSSGGLREFHGHVTDEDRFNIGYAVTITHAISSEAQRLMDMDSCGLPELPSPEWDSTVIGRIASSLASVRTPLLAVETTTDFEREQLEKSATVFETIGMLLQQPGDLRKIISTVVVHGNMSMMIGMRPGGGGFGGGSRPHGGSGGGPDGSHWGNGDGGWGHGGSSWNNDGNGWGHGGGSWGHGGSWSDDGNGWGHGGSSWNNDGNGWDHGGGSWNSDGGGWGHGGSSWNNDGSDWDSGVSGWGSGSDSGDWGSSSWGNGGSGWSSGGDSGDWGSSGWSSDWSSGDFSGATESHSFSVFDEPLRTSEIPWWKQDENPWVHHTTERPWWMSTEGPWWMSSTEHNWWMTTERPWRPGMPEGPGMGPGGPGMGPGMPGMPRMGVLGPLMRLQMFVSSAMVHLMVGNYEQYQLPVCMSEEISNNFRRFLQAVIWDTPVQQIPGYEQVSDDFVTNVRSLVTMMSMRKGPVMLHPRMLPNELGHRISTWFEMQGFSPMRPLPENFISGFLEEIVSVSRNFSLMWEFNQDVKNQSMITLGKMAGALLNNNREEVLDKFSSAVKELHRVTATEAMTALSSGQPGELPSGEEICKKMIELYIRRDSAKSVLLDKDGDIYSVAMSPLTGEFIWKKVLACKCSGPAAFRRK